MLAIEIGGKAVTCEKQVIDRYGRVVGIFHARSRDLHAWMDRNGWAIACTRCGGDIYDADQIMARVAQTGV